MGNVIQAIREREKEYLALCDKYNEKPELCKSWVDEHFGDYILVPNPYGKHAEKLRRRNEK